MPSAMHENARDVDATDTDRSGPSGVVVVIPALNEEESLPLVLRDLPPVRDVIVVDNGSTDATSAVAHAAGATVVWEPKRGYGSACLRGLAAIAARHQAAPPDVVVFLDADYSDHPEFLPQLVEPILAGQAQFALGSRRGGGRADQATGGARLQRGGADRG